MRSTWASTCSARSCCGASVSRHGWPTEPPAAGTATSPAASCVADDFAAGPSRSWAGGSPGREAARMLHALGMRPSAVKADPGRRADAGWREPGTGDPEGALPDRLVGTDGLLEVVGESDVVVLTLPATPRTLGLIDATVLGAMRPHALLVNVGRGALVDQGAPARRSPRAESAGPCWTSPRPSRCPRTTRCKGAPNCLVTPHLSGWGDQAALWYTTALLFAENLRYAAGEPLLNVTSRAAGY
ncbi:MAG: NAD(P)-dependent oxidoreductase [Chloroflexota bacterium]